MRQTSGDVVWRAVVRFRRWLVARSFARTSCVTAPAAVLLTMAGLAAAGVPPLSAGWLLTAWLGGIGLAAAVAAVRAPSLAATASAVDRQLSLADRISAGLAFRSDDDPVSRLIVSSAATHIVRHAPTQVFPLNVQIRGAVAAAVICIALAAAYAGGGTGETTARTGGLTVSASSAAGSPEASQAGMSTDPSTGALRAPRGQAMTPAGDDVTTHLSQASVVAEARGSADASPASTMARNESAPREPGASRPQQAASGGSSGSASAAAGSNRSGGRRSAPGTDAAAGGTGAGGAPSDAAPHSERAGAGAAQPGRSSGTVRDAPATDLRNERRAAAVTWSNAQAAPGQADDNIPPPFRGHVRRYFAALGADRGER